MRSYEDRFARTVPHDRHAPRRGPRARLGRHLRATRPVALVSESLARELWARPGRGARQADSWRRRGRRLARGHRRRAGHARQRRRKRPPPTTVYWPPLHAGAPEPIESSHRNVTLAIRSPLAGNESFIRQIQQAVWSVNGSLPLASVRDDAGPLRPLARAHVVHARDARDRGRRRARARRRRPVRRDLVRRVAAAARDRDPARARRAAARRDRARFVRYGVGLAAIGVRDRARRRGRS